MIVKVFPAKIEGEMLTDAYRCTEILTFRRFPNSGFSKHPHLSAHKILVTSEYDNPYALQSHVANQW